MDSLKRLSQMNVEILFHGHQYVTTGEDVSAYFNRSIRKAYEFREMVETYWESEKGDMKRVMARIKAIEYDHPKEREQSEQGYRVNLEARIKSVLSASTSKT